MAACAFALAGSAEVSIVQGDRIAALQAITRHGDMSASDSSALLWPCNVRTARLCRTYRLVHDGEYTVVDSLLDPLIEPTIDALVNVPPHILKVLAAHLL